MKRLAATSGESFVSKDEERGQNMKKTKRNRNRKGIAVDIVACALSAVSVAFSIAAFVISLFGKIPTEFLKIMLDFMPLTVVFY